MSDFIPCPICGEAPEISTEGTWLEIDCCVSMSFQKFHILEDLPDVIRWTDIPSDSHGNLSEYWEKRVLDYAASHWNTRATMPEGDLEERMKAAGMIPLSQLVNGPLPMDFFMAHVAVKDHDTFEEWLKCRHEEMTRLQVGLELKEGGKEDELYEWAVAHGSAFGEMWCNWRMMKKRMEKSDE